MKLFDTHTHLQDLRLEKKVDEMMARAQRAGVAACLVCGTRQGDWPGVLMVSESFAEALPAYGVHPWFVKDLSVDWLTALAVFLEKSRAVAVGEVGLDFMVEKESRELQEEVFVAQLRLAKDLRLPLSIHCRKAWGRMVELLKQEGGLPYGGAIHSFSGSVEMVREFERLGAFISFSGSLTRPANLKGKKAAKAVSNERLLIETDSPDILPENVSGPLNEPAYVVEVVRSLADVRGDTLESIAEITWNNASTLFYRRDKTL